MSTQPEARLPLFVSVAVVVRDQADDLERLLVETQEVITQCVADHELIVIDNASRDYSLVQLRKLTGEAGLPNLQVYALVKPVDADTAACVALENALGDFVVLFDPFTDDIMFLPKMLERAIEGSDAVFAHNENKPRRPFLHRIGYACFTTIYRWSDGVDLSKDAPPFRVLSKRLVNFILQHSQPAAVYRSFSASAGFDQVRLSYASTPKARQQVSFRENLIRGVRILVSTTTAPMRLVTALSLFGAAANLGYSLYVVLIFFLMDNIEPGWASLSLQQSGMFFLFSLVFLVLGEYVLHMSSVAKGDPGYHVGTELTSMKITRHQKLNVEEVLSSDQGEPPRGSG